MLPLLIMTALLLQTAFGMAESLHLGYSECLPDKCQNDCRGHRQAFSGGECREWGDNSGVKVCTCLVKLSAASNEGSATNVRDEADALCRSRFGSFEVRQKAFATCNKSCGDRGLKSCSSINGCECK